LITDDATFCCLVPDFDTVVRDFDTVIRDFDTIVPDFDTAVPDFDTAVHDFDTVVHDLNSDFSDSHADQHRMAPNDAKKHHGTAKCRFGQTAQALMRGKCRLIRFADDFVIVFERKNADDAGISGGFFLFGTAEVATSRFSSQFSA